MPVDSCGFEGDVGPGLVTLDLLTATIGVLPAFVENNWQVKPC